MKNFSYEGLVDETYRMASSKNTHLLNYDIEAGINTFIIKKVEDKETAKTFEVSSRKYLDLIVQVLFNKRFPYQEELVFNISDPGYSWWLEECENGLNIFLNSCHLT